MKIKSYAGGRDKIPAVLRFYFIRLLKHPEIRISQKETGKIPRVIPDFFEYFLSQQNYAFFNTKIHMNKISCFA